MDYFCFRNSAKSLFDFGWIQTPIPALNNCIPLDLTLTFMGSQLVMEELKKIN